MTVIKEFFGHTNSSNESADSRVRNSKRIEKSSPSRDQKKNYSQNKRAFDSVMGYLRKMGEPQLGPVGAVNPERAGSGNASAKNPAKPSMVDFRCDVFMAIKAVIPRGVSLVDFHLAYTLFDSDDEIERNVHAEKILHGRCHSVEQRLGAEFIRRKLFPVQGRGYFYSPRRPR